MQLMLGDCLERMKEITDGSVDLVLTDPPYGTTACKWDAVIPFEPMWAQVWRVLKPNGAVVLMATQPFTTCLIASQMTHFRYDLVWDKVNRFTGHFLAKKMPLRSHETALVFYKKLPTYNPQFRVGVPYSSKSSVTLSPLTHGRKERAARSQVSDGSKANPGSIIREKAQVGRNVSVHPTQKPVALMEYLIRTYTNEGETVLDFTMGSGTTGVACVNTGRRFIGIERDETYFEIAEKRIAEAMCPEKS